MKIVTITKKKLTSFILTIILGFFCLAFLFHGDDWSHAVVTVGYEEFTHSYQVYENGAWVTKEDTYRYLRCIDGWGTSNSAQYVDLAFYDNVMAYALDLS